MDILGANKRSDEKREKETNESFVKEYNALCEKYNRVWIPAVALQLHRLDEVRKSQSGIVTPK